MGKFQKGIQKVPNSGRKAGTPNKKTQDLFEKCEKHGVDPFESLLLIARDGEKEETRMQACKELCKYLYPQRKAVEHTTDEQQGFMMVIKDYTKKNEDTSR
jgi:hypothetical protein